jgi:YidC/Oxa1 family membrane protein insertase
MQQRNLLLFFVLTALILLTYFNFRARLVPQPQPGEVAKKKEEEKKQAAAAAVQLPALPPVTPDAKLLELGEQAPDSKFNLQVVLDPLGGGVRSVTLNKFRPSDEDGRPGDGQVLDLVPAEANLHEPSHLLYHFAPSDKDWDARPLDTLGRRQWKVVEHNGKPIVHDQTDDGKARQQVSFRTEIDGVILTKTFSVVEGEYHVGLQVTMERPKAPANAKPSEKEPIKFRYQLTGAKGLPVEGKWYTGTFRNAMILLEGANGALDRKLQDLRQIDVWGGGNAVDREEGKILRYAAVAVQYFASVIVVDDRQENQKFLRRATPSLETAVARGRMKGQGQGLADSLTLTSDDGKTTTTVFLPPHLQGALAGVKEGQQVAVVYQSLSYDEALKECPKVAVDVRTGLEAQATHAMWINDITVRVATEPVSLAPGAKETHSYLLYNGPVKPSLLRYLRDDRAVENDLIDRYAYTLNLNTLTDYQSPGWMGSFAHAIFWTSLVIKCTNFMHLVLGKLSLAVPSYGLSIILLTLLVRLSMLYFSRKQTAMSLKMQALQPELKKLAAKHGTDKAAYAQAQMALFRQHGVNPLGSCWIVLLQMPIFMGLYFALQESIQFRLASFFPTWIVNLAAPDMLWKWGRHIPLISRDADYGGLLYLGPYLNLLPILAVGLMVVQQKMMMPPPADKEQEFQQKFMRIMMIVMGLFFYKIAAGLCIYIITSTLWGFAERKLLPKAKPVGIDTDLDKRVSAMAAKASDAPSGSAPETGVRKGAKAKRKSERIRKEEDAKTGLGSLRQRLSAWWNDVLEQAKKK